MKPYASHPKQPPKGPHRPPHKSWIKRVRDVVYDVATQTWKIQLECFHKLELDKGVHNMAVVARWCPTCVYQSTGTVTV